MRIAVVRAGNLNPWELANYEADDMDVVAFGSRSGSFGAHGLPLTAQRFASPADTVRRLPSPAQAIIRRLGGEVDWLAGLGAALTGFDVAHAAELSNPCSLQALRAREAGSVQRVVLTVWENIAFPAPANGAVRRRVARVAAGVDRALAISERARLHLEVNGVPAERIEVVPMGVDLTRFTPRTSQAHDGPLRVLSIGRLVPEKGHEDLVLAAHLLRARGVETRVTIAGEGPLRARLVNMIEVLGLRDRIALVGTVPYGDLPALHHVHDVFVLASAPRTTWQEQFGFAVVEAMASGLPVLAGDSGSLDEVVGDRRQLVAPQQPAALAAELERLVDEPAERSRRGAANRLRAEAIYDRRNVARRIRSFYEHALAEPVRH